MSFPGTGRAAATNYAIASDRDLVNRFVTHGDHTAFAALVSRHGPRVLSVCTRVLKDRHAAEDAFQTTFLVLAQKAATLGRPDAVGSWLYGVALRTALSARADLPPPVRPPEPTESDPSAQVAQEELRLVLDEELCRLAEFERSLLVMVYLDGKTHEEVAAELGCPLGSISWRLSKARELLRSRLARRGITLSLGALLLLASMGNAQAVSPELLARTTASGAPKRRPLVLTSRKPVGYAVLALLLVVLVAAAVGFLGMNRHTVAAPHDTGSHEHCSHNSCIAE